MHTIKSILPRAALLVCIFTLLCGVMYTAVVTGIAQCIFPRQANGSMLSVEGKTYGCALLGQPYTDVRHLWGRMTHPDATTFVSRDGKRLLYAWPSNLSPASEEYESLVAARVKMLRAAHPERGTAPIPVDLVTVSGSGLDPDISVSAALYQAERIARYNEISVAKVHTILAQCTTPRTLGFLGEETVNVLRVNLMLDGVLAVR
ncbi:MAG: K(+)-transporting ATPase subunit C [Clostridia bacterium]